MSRTMCHLVMCLVMTLAVGAAPFGAQAPAGTAATSGDRAAVHGTVSDQSAGVLPGVTVTATAGGHVLALTATDADGAFVFRGLPPGAVTLTFHLTGFDDAVTTVTIDSAPAADITVAPRLALSGRTEAVTVRAEAPPPPPPDRPVLAPVPDYDPASVCGPSIAEAPVPSFGTIRSHADESVQGIFSAGDELRIDGGTATGLGVGQNLVVRRRYDTGLTVRKGLIIEGEHTSGLVQLVEVDERASTAVVVFACDGMLTGDYLVPFVPAPLWSSDPYGQPGFDNPARVLFADAGQMVGVPRRMMVIDRGEQSGLHLGQRLTLFRRSRFGDSRPTVVGQALIVAVRRTSATIRVEQATDAIYFGNDGDWAAPQRLTARASD